MRLKYQFNILGTNSLIKNFKLVSYLGKLTHLFKEVLISNYEVYLIFFIVAPPLIELHTCH